MLETDATDVAQNSLQNAGEELGGGLHSLKSSQHTPPRSPARVMSKFHTQGPVNKTENRAETKYRKVAAVLAIAIARQITESQSLASFTTLPERTSPHHPRASSRPRTASGF